jgi:hypothetical protein
MSEPTPAGTPFPFVVAVSRSGTTLLRLMLDAHPDLAIPPESFFITGLHKLRRRYERRDGVFDFPRFASDLSRLRKFRDWDVPPEALAAAFGERAPGDYPDAIRRLYRLYADLQGKPRFGDKSPGYVARIRLLAEWFPEAIFVHLIRDPRPVALSLSEMEWGPSDVVEGAVRWRHYVGRGREAGRELGSGRYLEVRYERLVEDPESTLRRLTSFLHLPFREEMLDYQRRALERVPAREHRQHVNLVRPPAATRDWRSQVSAEDLAAVEAVAGDLMDELGYERAARPDRRAASRAAEATDRWRRYLGRRRRKGRLRSRLTVLRPSRSRVN